MFICRNKRKPSLPVLKHFHTTSAFHHDRVMTSTMAPRQIGCPIPHPPMRAWSEDQTLQVKQLKFKTSFSRLDH